MDRYLFGRKFDDGKNAPFNLLFQLSAKHLRIKWESYLTKDKEEYVNEIIKFAEAILNICDIQGTSGIEYSMMNSECFPIYLINEMIFDKICVAQQYSAKFILMSLDYLIKPWFSYANTNYSYEDYYKVTKYVLNIQALCDKLNIRIMQKETGVALYLLRQILRDISIPANEVNKELVSLDSKTNLFTKPIIAFPLENYIFLEEHFCGIGFLNVAIDMIRKNYPRLGREQGGAVEKMLRDEMQKKGFGIKGGNYQEKNHEKGGECDLVLEDSKLAFIEIKKKYITDELDILDDVTVLENMAFGMICAQKQCFQHEKYLKVNREILFDESGQKITYDENKVPAYKISVCYPEYSFLTNKMFSMNLLEILLKGEFKAVEINNQEKLDKLNKVGEKIRKCIIEQNQENNINGRNISFYSLFCSMQQILTAVWWCDNEKEFFEVLEGWIYYSDKTLDPYMSLLETKELLLHPEKNRVRKSMMELVRKRNTSTMVIA